MVYIGCHLSVTNGYEAMGRQMTEFGGNTFAWFTRNPRGGKTKPADPEDISALQQHLGLPHLGQKSYPLRDIFRIAVDNLTKAILLA